MSRVQLAINVDDIDAAIDFYSKLFGTGPAKVREGYANFAIADPPLKLVLIENRGEGGSLNHLGVEVESTDEVGTAITRLQADGLATLVEEQTTCCYAVQDKVWVHGPNGEPWEIYTVLADAPVMHPVPAAGDTSDSSTDAACCTPDGAGVPKAPIAVVPELADDAADSAVCCTPTSAAIELGATRSTCC
jgi:catechol 2,3-dioxygenase-like lactoylglutathione lyase family enzyme